MKYVRLLVLAAATAACVALTAPSAAFANYAESQPFSCAASSSSTWEVPCTIRVTTDRAGRYILGSANWSRGIWLDSTHAVHNWGGYATVAYYPPSNNPHWQWRACGWFYHVHAPRHIV